jgi:hypothetical protein
MDAFLVVPLACAGQDQGALLITSRAPVSLDKYSRLLAADLGHALSQTLYTLSCIGQMRAGEAIIADIMPEQVRPNPDLILLGLGPTGLAGALAVHVLVCRDRKNLFSANP